jgi:hypothetical protein
MIPIGDADYSFIAAAADQLHPTQRPVFAERVRALLQDIVDPGPGDIDRAVARGAARNLGAGAGDIWSALAVVALIDPPGTLPRTVTPPTIATSISPLIPANPST